MHIWEEPSLWDDLVFPQKEKSGRANRRTAVEAHTGFTHRPAAKDGGRGRESHARKSVDSAEPFPRLRSTDEGVNVPGDAGGGGPAGVSPSVRAGAACAGSRQATLSSRRALLIRVALRQCPEQQLRQKPPWEDRAQTGGGEDRRPVQRHEGPSLCQGRRRRDHGRRPCRPAGQTLSALATPARTRQWARGRERRRRGPYGGTAFIWVRRALSPPARRDRLFFFH